MDINYLSATGLTASLTASIVESGDNYIRFSNGIQMCFGSVATNNVIDQMQSFTKGEYHDLKNVITYPKPFVIRDFIAPFTIAIRSNSFPYDKPTIDNCINVIGTSSTETSMGLRIYTLADRDYRNEGVAAFDMGYLAIGKWK